MFDGGDDVGLASAGQPEHQGILAALDEAGRSDADATIGLSNGGTFG
jgi:hypothetical protein